MRNSATKIVWPAPFSGNLIKRKLEQVVIHVFNLNRKDKNWSKEHVKLDGTISVGEHALD